MDAATLSAFDPRVFTMPAGMGKTTDLVFRPRIRDRAALKRKARRKAQRRARAITRRNR